MVRISWGETFRIVHSRYPFVGIFDEIGDPADIDAILEIEQRTNDRIRDAIGELSLIRPGDRVAGPGSTPIMAAFTHARPSRFTDGSYGVYYAAHKRQTAIFETRYHVEAFYHATSEESADIDMHIHVASIAGNFDDLRALPENDARLDPASYAAPQAYAKPLHDADVADGIAYPSVRDPERRACLACFRAKIIKDARTHGYLTYRFDGRRRQIADVFERESLSGGPT